MADVDRITNEPGKSRGRPCIRGLRRAVSDVLDHLASCMSEEDLLRGLADLTREDIRDCLAVAADRERQRVVVGARVNRRSRATLPAATTPGCPECRSRAAADEPCGSTPLE